MISDNRIIILKGDITLVDADAVVNAANTSLLGGGGVDGAIHKAAGSGLLEECRELNGCEVGEVKVTKGHNLKARFVFHAVGPIWKGGGNDEHMLLASCYRRAMEKASALKLETIAFPAISTGVYRFPHEEAAMVAVTEIRRFLNRKRYPETVYLVAFSDEQYSLYMKTLGR
jgi:O-acetyl-ADP-ribose deacetylase (regulator of RNase III)